MLWNKLMRWLQRLKIVSSLKYQHGTAKMTFILYAGNGIYDAQNEVCGQTSRKLWSIWFPRMAIDFVLQEETEEMIAAQEAFMEQKRLEEVALAQQAMQDFQKREQEKKDNPALANLGDRPFQLGMHIKDDEIMEIKRIVEEERRVIIEGFVFDTEIKELKSGRSLLQIKITDYTDSIIVKMFS